MGTTQVRSGSPQHGRCAIVQPEVSVRLHPDDLQLAQRADLPQGAAPRLCGSVRSNRGLV